MAFFGSGSAKGFAFFTLRFGIVRYTDAKPFFGSSSLQVTANKHYFFIITVCDKYNEKYQACAKRIKDSTTSTIPIVLIYHKVQAICQALNRFTTG